MTRLVTQLVNQYANSGIRIRLQSGYFNVSERFITLSLPPNVPKQLRFDLVVAFLVKKYY